MGDQETFHIFRSGSTFMAIGKPHQLNVIGSDMFNSPSSIINPSMYTQTTFSAYGVSVGSALPLSFKGELQDPVSGCYLLGNGYRAYSPALMRFYSPDSESPFGKGGMNTYAFVHCDPINRSDPTGHFFEFFSLPSIKKTYRGPIVAEFNKIVAFTGPQRTDGRLPTLYISAHGKPGLISGDRFNFYDSKRLFKEFTSRGIDMHRRQTHILACQSALPSPFNGQSIIQELSDLTQAQASGYAGAIYVYEGQYGNEYVVHKANARPSEGVSIKTRVGISRKLQPANIRSPLV